MSDAQLIDFMDSADGKVSGLWLADAGRLISKLLYCSHLRRQRREASEKQEKRATGINDHPWQTIFLVNELSSDMMSRKLQNDPNDPLPSPVSALSLLVTQSPSPVFNLIHKC